LALDPASIGSQGTIVIRHVHFYCISYKTVCIRELRAYRQWETIARASANTFGL